MLSHGKGTMRAVLAVQCIVRNWVLSTTLIPLGHPRHTARLCFLSLMDWLRKEGAHIIIEYGPTEYSAVIRTIDRSKKKVIVQYDEDATVETMTFAAFKMRLVRLEKRQSRAKDDEEYVPPASSSSDEFDPSAHRIRTPSMRKGGRQGGTPNRSPRLARKRRGQHRAAEHEEADGGLRCNECKNSGTPYNEEENSADAITMEKLDSVHIEWVSPDGNMKQCYNMGTLLQIACRSSGARVLKQPPHFRAPMDNFLKAQVEAKFPGLVDKVEGSMPQQQLRLMTSGDYHTYDSDDSDQEFAFHMEDHARWDDYLERYWERYEQDASYLSSEWLSSVGNLYACPICIRFLSANYEHWERAKKSDSRSAEDGDGNVSSSSSSTSGSEDNVTRHDDEDPLEALTYLGCHVGAAACTNTMASMKAHLKEAHSVPKSSLTQKSGFNDVMKRFVLRGADGLIQSYCHSHDNRAEMNYWSEEHWLNRGRYNQLYMHVGHRQSYLPVWLCARPTDVCFECSEKHHLQYFQELLKRWSHSKTADDEQFIASENSLSEDEVSSGSEEAASSSRRLSSPKKSVTPSVLFMTQQLRETDDVKDMVEELQRRKAQRRRKEMGLYSSSGEDSNESDSGSSEDEIIHVHSDVEELADGPSRSIRSVRAIREKEKEHGYKIGEKMEVLYRALWYDARAMKYTENGMLVEYCDDKSTEEILAGDFNDRLRKLTVDKAPKKRKLSLAAACRDTSEDDEGSALFSSPVPSSHSKKTPSAKKRRVFQSSSSDSEDCTL